MANPHRKQAHLVLGMNARSLWYTNQFGSKRGTKIANDKLATKRILQKAGITTPRLFATLQSRQELLKFRWTKLPSSFVLKPRASSGGGGIIVIYGRNKKGNWVTADKTEVIIPELRKHVLDILDGNFSSANVPDIALFEQRVKNHPDLKQYCSRGVADIRVLVHNSVPIMAMLRLPTDESHGKANLHAGGIGIGIDLARGVTTTAIYRGQLIDTLPNSRLHLAGITIPHWQSTLLTAVKAAAALDLSFAGVDIALDRDDGPVVLEINARPGLDIQLANMAPLRARLLRVADLNITTAAKGVAIGKNLFGGDIDQEIEDTTGQTVLGIIEPVQITDGSGQQHSVMAKIDTGAYRSAIDSTLAAKLNVHTKIIDHKKYRAGLGRQERPIIELTITLRDHTLNTQVSLIDRSHMKYDVLIGRRDLKGFLVDPTKNSRAVN